jgi:hypothetical protein
MSGAFAIPSVSAPGDFASKCKHSLLFWGNDERATNDSTEAPKRIFLLQQHCEAGIVARILGDGREDERKTRLCVRMGGGPD